LVLHFGIGDSQATSFFSLIIVPLVGIMVWFTFKDRLHTVARGETVPQKVFPGDIDRLKK